MLENGKVYSTIRVYFNQKEDYPAVWSVDDGDQSNEIHTNRVIVQGVCKTIYEGDGGKSKIKTKEIPVAWIEVRNALLTLNEEVAFINNCDDY